MNSADAARVLVLMRHGRTEAFASSDIERELTDEGRDDVRATARWLLGRGIEPGQALVSTAARAQQTWQQLVEETGWTAEPDIDSALYTAGADTAVNVLRQQLLDDTRVAIVVGHNPTMSYLAQMFDDGSGDSDALSRMALGYPPSAVTVLTYDGSWADLSLGALRIEAFHVGNR